MTAFPKNALFSPVTVHNIFETGETVGFESFGQFLMTSLFIIETLAPESHKQDIKFPLIRASQKYPFSFPRLFNCKVLDPSSDLVWLWSSNLTFVRLNVGCFEHCSVY